MDIKAKENLVKNIKSWLSKRPLPHPAIAFTDGPERQIAYLICEEIDTPKPTSDDLRLTFALELDVVCQRFIMKGLSYVDVIRELEATKSAVQVQYLMDQVEELVEEKMQ